MSGTSMACPHVSGVVALMLSANPSATPSQIVTALRSSSENTSTSGKDSYLGYGVVNALAAVEAISSYNNNDIAEDVNENIGNDVNNSEENSNASSAGGTGSDNSGCVELVITLRTDRYASDTSHWLQTGTEYKFFENTFDSFETYRETDCIDPLQCTTYNVRDAFGDGISGEGVEIKYGGEVVYSGGEFGIGGIKYLGSC